MLSKKKIMWCLDQMHELFPTAHCELVHENPFELVIATLLSAQCTDVLVNRVTKDLFKKYKKPQDYLAVSLEELQNDIRSIGLYKGKAKNIQGLCRILLDKYQGSVPKTREQLVELPGVGRKTANVVLSVAFDIPAFAVDTHVERISKRLNICRKKDNVLQVEESLMAKIPEERWSSAHHQMIFFGRYHCTARNPKCEQCPLLVECKEGQRLLLKH